MPACGGTRVSSDPFALTAASMTPGAVIRYTTDGSDPTDQSLVLTGSGVAIDQPTIVKLRAWADDYAPSPVETVSIRMQVLQPWAYPGYGGYADPVSVALFTHAGADIHYTTDGSVPTANSTLYTGPILLSTYTRLRAVGIRAGWEPSLLFDGVYWFHYGSESTPTITPLSGSYYYGQMVSISADANAVMRYTTDGTIPTSDSPVYTGPFLLTKSMTLTARADNPDYDSSVATATYDVKMAPPVFSPGAGSYANGQVITVTDASPGATIHFTTNGVDPSLNDPVIANGGSRPVGNYTLKARAFRDGVPSSDIVSAEYQRIGDSCRLSLTPPVIVAGPNASGGIVSVSAPDASCTWTVFPEVNWLAAGSSGTGTTGQVAYHLSANTTADMRAASIEIGDQSVLVVQSGQPACTFDVAPSALAAPANGANRAVTVATTDGACGWTASSNAPWLTGAVATDLSGYAQAVLGDHPIGYWRLNETAGTNTAADVSGSGRTGVVTGAVAFGWPGPLADGATTALFDGATSGIVVPSDAAFDLPALSWDAWVDVSFTSSTARRIFGKGVGEDEAWSLWIEPNASSPTLYFRTAAGRQAVTFVTPVVGAGWTHVAFTYDASSWHAYVNGVEDSSGTASGSLQTVPSPVTIGRDELSQAWFDGQLAEVAVYPYALAADQVVHHHSSRTLTGIGGGDVTYQFGPNTSADTRMADLAVAGVAIPAGQAASGGVVITAGASPRPNEAGWNTTDVRVTYACAGDGYFECPLPVVVYDDGERDITGTVTSDRGASATTTVHLKIDRTAPILNVNVHPGELVDAGAVTISGTVTSLGAGVQSVFCNGVAATIAGGSFTCALTVPPGRTNVVILGVGAFGATRTTTTTVTTTDVLATDRPTSLRISPQQATMLLGETRTLHALDNRSRIPNGIVWTVDHPEVAAVVADAGGVTVTATGAGTATITATWHELVATTEISVPVAVGTNDVITRWTASPPLVSGNRVQQVVQGYPTPDGPGLIFVVERDDFREGHRPDLLASSQLRAFNADGTERWGFDVGGRIDGVAADPGGGALVSMMQFNMDGETLVSNPSLLVQVSADGDVRTLYSDSVYLPTVHPDGPLVVEEDSGDGVNGRLTTVDIGYGGGGRTWPLTGMGGKPAVLEDGSIVVVTSKYTEPFGIALTINRAYLDGRVETTPIAGCPSWICWDFDPTHPGLALPNGKGGYLIQFNDRTNADPSILGVDANGQVTGITNMSLGTTQLVIGETSAMAIGPLPFWANAYNLDDIATNNNRALQQHLGLMQEITLEGGPIGGATWLNPAGDCGNSYAGFDTWVDLGDCAGPQPVYNVTSVIAESGGGFTVSLSDGSVSSPNPQLQTLDPADLQPRPDGSYIGTNQAHQLINLIRAANTGSYTPARSAFPGYGAPQSGTAAPYPRIITFIPIDPGKGEDGEPGKASFIKNQLLNESGYGNLRAIPRTLTIGDATDQRFKAALMDTNYSAVAFIGHALEHPIAGSIGVQLFDRTIVKRAAPGQAQYGQSPDRDDIIDKLSTRVKVVFIASCETADTFQTLWDITSSTPDRTLIVPVANTDTGVNLYQGYVAWYTILHTLTNVDTKNYNKRPSVFDAVKAANTEMERLRVPLRFKAVGGNDGHNVEIP